MHPVREAEEETTRWQIPSPSESDVDGDNCTSQQPAFINRLSPLVIWMMVNEDDDAEKDDDEKDDDDN